MDVIVISVVAFLTAFLTFFSGFGLGMVLTLLFMIFFSVQVAVSLAAIVHFIYYLFKLMQTGRKADNQILVRFGIPAVLGAFAGAWILLHIPDHKPLFSYHLGGKTIEVYTVKLTVSVWLLFFTLVDLFPFLYRIELRKKHFPLGGWISGFFGGLSGSQGALRSAFLVRSGLSKETFISTTVVISCFVDFTRLSVYITQLSLREINTNLTLMIMAALAALAGALLGKRLLHKTTLRFVHSMVAVILIGLSIGLAIGVI